MKKYLIFGSFIFSLFILSSCSTKTSTQSTSNNEQPKNKISGQTYNDAENYYSFTCPDDFLLNSNLDFDGKIKVIQCSISYSDTIPEFADGINIGFEFVPTELSNTYMSGNQLWSVKKMNLAKIPQSRTYTNNGFSGWMSAGEGNGYITYIARRVVAGGYYEASATIADLKSSSAVTIQEREAIVDKVIGSFIINE